MYNLCPSQYIKNNKNSSSLFKEYLQSSTNTQYKNLQMQEKADKFKAKKQTMMPIQTAADIVEGPSSTVET